MCFHYSLTKEALERENIYDPTLEFPFMTQYHVNGFSYPEMPVLSNEEGGKLKLMKWGLIPKWANTVLKAEEIRQNTHNARSETVFEKSSFKNSMGKKHCLVFASGFYEWMHVGKEKYPHYIHLKDNSLMAFAGIWERTIISDSNEVVESYSIITCDANPLMERIHNSKKRMPVILPKDRWMEWLKPDLTREQIISFLCQFPQEQMSAYTISRLITSRKESSNVEKVMERVDYPELALFLQ